MIHNQLQIRGRQEAWNKSHRGILPLAKGKDDAVLDRILPHHPGQQQCSSTPNARDTRCPAQRPNVPGSHCLGRMCCHYSCALTGSRQGCPSSHRVSQKRVTPPFFSREKRHQPCREPRTVSALIPTSCSCTLGSSSAENTTEQTGAWSDRRVLSSGERGMESLPVSGCHHSHHNSTRQTLSGMLHLISNHAGSLVHGRDSHMQPHWPVSFPCLAAHTGK